MQMQLEKAQENYSHISQIRVQAEEQLQKLQLTHAEEEQLTAQERLKVTWLSHLAPMLSLLSYLPNTVRKRCVTC